jgi:hypothetical protein
MSLSFRFSYSPSPMPLERCLERNMEDMAITAWGRGESVGDR